MFHILLNPPVDTALTELVKEITDKREFIEGIFAEQSMCVYVCVCVCVCVCACACVYLNVCIYIHTSVCLTVAYIAICITVLREDDNSEKTNSYIDAAMGKREPIEKVNSTATSCGYVHTHLYIHHHHYRYSDWCVYSQWPIMASSLNCWNSINVISFRYVLYHIWYASDKNRMD